ncbi:MAG: hypothetical protein WC389_18655, partial [Lutibacter sp.]
MKKNTTLFLRIALVLVIAGLFTSCSVVQIGELTMVTTRNYESTKNYKLLKNYTLGTKKEKRTSKSATIKDAMNKTLRTVAGGEYLTNAKIYLIAKGGKKYYAAEGDVWGVEGVV